MPSYLDDYPGGASDRVAKFHRAIESVTAQHFESWELIVVADGCKRTWAERDHYLWRGERMLFFEIPKQRRWSPHVRNFGLTKASGQYVCYLDTDDILGRGHLTSLHDGLLDADLPPWRAFSSRVFDRRTGTWATQDVADLLARNRAGTSNIVHRSGLCYWPEIEYRHPGYGYATEDRAFVDALSVHAAPVVLQAGEYYVCHIPNDYDI